MFSRVLALLSSTLMKGNSVAVHASTMHSYEDGKQLAVALIAE